MFENMAGAVGFAMHADRLAKAATNRRLTEATQGQRHRLREVVRKEYRAEIAAALVALATRIAPSLTLSDLPTQ